MLSSVNRSGQIPHTDSEDLPPILFGIDMKDSPAFTEVVTSLWMRVYVATFIALSLKCNSLLVLEDSPSIRRAFRYSKSIASNQYRVAMETPYGWVIKSLAPRTPFGQS